MIKKCKFCNKKFKIFPCLVKRAKYNFCSIKCRSDFKKTNLKDGSNGIVKNRLQIQNEVKLRDGNKCTICGRIDVKLCVHHIDESQHNNNWEHANNNLDNLITVCHHCHSRIHLGKKLNNYIIADNLETIKNLRNEGKTLQYIGDSFNVSRERIRQVIKKYNLT